MSYKQMEGINPHYDKLGDEYNELLKEKKQLESRIAELEKFHNSFVSSHSTENCLDYCRGKDAEINALDQRNRALVSEVNRLKALLQEFQTSSAVYGKFDRKLDKVAHYYSKENNK